MNGNTEKITLIWEYHDGEKVTETRQASIRAECVKMDDVWDWLPDAFRAVGFTSMGDDLKKARGK